MRTIFTILSGLHDRVDTAPEVTSVKQASSARLQSGAAMVQAQMPKEKKNDRSFSVSPSNEILKPAQKSTQLNAMNDKDLAPVVQCECFCYCN
jgi:hypothetical protein